MTNLTYLRGKKTTPFLLHINTIWEQRLQRDFSGSGAPQ